MVLRMSKKGILGEPMQKAVNTIDDSVLGTVEHATLFYATNSLMPANSTLLRRTGIFLAISIAYNLILDKSLSSESSGMGRI